MACDRCHVAFFLVFAIALQTFLAVRPDSKEATIVETETDNAGFVRVLNSTRVHTENQGSCKCSVEQEKACTRTCKSPDQCCEVVREADPGNTAGIQVFHVFDRCKDAPCAAGTSNAGAASKASAALPAAGGISSKAAATGGSSPKVSKQMTCGKKANGKQCPQDQCCKMVASPLPGGKSREQCVKSASAPGC